MLAALGEIRDTYQANGHGVELVELGEGWQVLTRPEFTDAIERAQLAARHTGCPVLPWRRWPSLPIDSRSAGPRSRKSAA